MSIAIARRRLFEPSIPLAELVWRPLARRESVIAWQHIGTGEQLEVRQRGDEWAVLARGSVAHYLRTWETRAEAEKYALGLRQASPGGSVIRGGTIKAAPDETTERKLSNKPTGEGDWTLSSSERDDIKLAQYGELCVSSPPKRTSKMVRNSIGNGGKTRSHRGDYTPQHQPPFPLDSQYTIHSLTFVHCSLYCSLFKGYGLGTRLRLHMKRGFGS